MSRQLRSTCSGSVARGFFAATVSSKRQASQASDAMPNTAVSPSVTRQPSACAVRLPISGLAIEISPRPPSAIDITCAPRAGSYRSRMIERPQVTVAAMPTPCSARQPTSAATLPASAAPMPAAVNSASPASSTGRRPKRSATGPQPSCARPKQTISADSVSCSVAIDAPKSRPSAGSAGR